MYEGCKSMKYGIRKKKEREKYLAKKLGEKGFEKSFHS